MTSVMEACESERDWPDRLRAVAHTVVGSLRAEPSRASFAVEVLAAGDAARARRDMTMRVIASLIDAGRREMEDPSRSPTRPPRRWPARPTGRSTRRSCGATPRASPAWSRS